MAERGHQLMAPRRSRLSRDLIPISFCDKQGVVDVLNTVEDFVMASRKAQCQ
jgi:hypothetical protein